MNKKQLKYVARIGREYDQLVFEAELYAAAMVNAQPDHRYKYVVAVWHGDGWNFDYYRTALEALKCGRFAYTPRYFIAHRRYCRLFPTQHERMILYAWGEQCR